MVNFTSASRGGADTYAYYGCRQKFCIFFCQEFVIFVIYNRNTADLYNIAVSISSCVFNVQRASPKGWKTVYTRQTGRLLSLLLYLSLVLLLLSLSGHICLQQRRHCCGGGVLSRLETNAYASKRIAESNAFCHIFPCYLFVLLHLSRITK
jgi:hypothetical protein